MSNNSLLARAPLYPSCVGHVILISHVVFAVCALSGDAKMAEGVNCRLQVAGCRLQVAGAGCRLQVQGAGCRLQVAGCRCRLQVAGCRL